MTKEERRTENSKRCGENRYIEFRKAIRVDAKTRSDQDYTRVDLLFSEGVSLKLFDYTKSTREKLSHNTLVSYLCQSLGLDFEDIPPCRGGWFEYIDELMSLLNQKKYSMVYAKLTVNEEGWITPGEGQCFSDSPNMEYTDGDLHFLEYDEITHPPRERKQPVDDFDSVPSIGAARRGREEAMSEESVDDSDVLRPIEEPHDDSWVENLPSTEVPDRKPKRLVKELLDDLSDVYDNLFEDSPKKAKKDVAKAVKERAEAAGAKVHKETLKNSIKEDLEMLADKSPVTPKLKAKAKDDLAILDTEPGLAKKNRLEELGDEEDQIWAEKNELYKSGDNETRIEELNDQEDAIWGEKDKLYKEIKLEEVGEFMDKIWDPAGEKSAKPVKPKPAKKEKSSIETIEPLEAGQDPMRKKRGKNLQPEDFLPSKDREFPPIPWDDIPY